MSFRGNRMVELLREPRHEKAPPGPFNHVDGLLELIDYAKPKTVLEIGSHRGVSTEVFLLHCHEVTVIDPWPKDEHYRAFLDRCAAYRNLRIVRGKSPEEQTRFAPKEFDLCYIDAEHYEPDVRADIIGCVPVARKWIAGHDFNHPTVERTVLLLLGEPEEVFSDSSWIVRVGPDE
jgi:hypothetical protein